MAQKFGGKLVLLSGLSSIAVLTLLTPVLTIVGGFPALFAIRLLEGIAGVYQVTVLTARHNASAVLAVDILSICALVHPPTCL